MYLLLTTKATNIRNKAAKTTLFLSRVPRLCVAVLSAYYPNESSWICRSSSLFFEHVMKLERTRGIEYTVKYTKTSRNACLRVLSGEPLKKCDGVLLDKNGYPAWISILFEEANGCHIRLRILLTYLTSLRSITLRPKLDIDSITLPSLGRDDIFEFELRRVKNALNLRGVTFKGESFTPHMSTKKGPVGQAIMSSITELTFIPQSLVNDIILLGGVKLGADIESLTDRLDILDYSSTADW